MPISTEDAKKIVAAYLLAARNDPSRRTRRRDLVRTILMDYGVPNVGQLPVDKIDMFLRTLLDEWDRA